MAADSRLILVGTVVRQAAAADITPNTDFTISDVQVQRVAKGGGVSVPAGTVIKVRQTGSDKQPPPTPLMIAGSSYLLFLTPSGLSGSLATQYYITGNNAGLYSAGGSVQAKTPTVPLTLPFEQVQRAEGENLPARLTITQAVPN